MIIIVIYVTRKAVNIRLMIEFTKKKVADEKSTDIMRGPKTVVALSHISWALLGSSDIL
jgi:hypothetical protein